MEAAVLSVHAVPEVDVVARHIVVEVEVLFSTDIYQVVMHS